MPETLSPLRIPEDETDRAGDSCGSWTTYRRCFRRDVDSPSASSDASSIFSASASAWRAEDSHAASGAVAAKHRKRLKKLDQVAPAQSLAQWRRQKQTTHVQTFASVSNKLICAICLDLMQEKELIRELHCGHVYHASCLDLWVERGHHDCPMCKYDILGLSKENSKALEIGLPVEGREEHGHEVQQSSGEEPAAVDQAAVVVAIDGPATVVRDQAPAPVPALLTAHGANNEQPRQE